MAANVETATCTKQDDSLIISPSPNRRRSTLFTLTAFYMIFYVGAFFGFGPMQLMLEEDGAFSHLCNHTTILNNTTVNSTRITEPSTNPPVCAIQSRTLQYVSFIATILAQLATPIFGAISDRYGPLILHVLLSILGCMGIAIILVSSLTQIYGLLYLAFILIGFMSMASAPIIMEVAYLYSLPSSRRKVISSLNCLWDVGGGVGYWILWIIAHSSRLSFLLVMGLYLIVGCIVYAISTYLWKVILIAPANFPKPTELLLDDSIDPSNILTSTPSKKAMSADEHNNQTSFGGEQDVDSMRINKKEPIDFLEDSTVESTTVRDSEFTVSLSLNRTSFLKHVTSTRFILLTFIFSIHVSRILFTLTSARDFLKYLGDDQTGNRYLTILSLLSPAAILGLPMVDFFVERWGYIVSLQIINIVAIIHGIILVGSTNLNVQILGFILLAVYRCLTFAIILSYLEVVSEKHVLGKLTGIICLVPGLFQLINLPLSNWALDSLHGNFFWPNLMYTLFVVPCILGVWYLGCLQKP